MKCNRLIKILLFLKIKLPNSKHIRKKLTRINKHEHYSKNSNEIKSIQAIKHIKISMIMTATYTTLKHLLVRTNKTMII